MTLLNDAIPFSYIAKQKNKSRHDIYSVISKINQVYYRFSGQLHGLSDCTFMFKQWFTIWKIFRRMTTVYYGGSYVA